MVEEWKKRIQNILCIIVMLFLFTFTMVNLGLAFDVTKELIDKEITFSEYIELIQTNYTSDDLFIKNKFVNLNGLFARVTGRTFYNDVILAENDMLVSVLRNRNVEPLAESIIELSDYLDKDQEIPFLYVQMPAKEDTYDEIFPDNFVSYGNEGADILLDMLEDREILTLDLRPHISSSPELIKEYFYDTDHHWNSTGAFLGYQFLVEQLIQIFPDRGINLDYANEENWEKHVASKCYLGSKGRRVGKYYCGVDDLMWHTPVFDTEMSCIVPKSGMLYRGDFVAANIREKYINNKEYYKYDAYNVYIGGIYPLVQHRNLGAPSDLRILYLSDSFTLPVQAFMSTMFKEIDVIDPRYYTDSTIVDYVEQMKPDVVIMGINPDALGDSRYYEYGIEEKLEEANKLMKCVWENDVVVDAIRNDINYTAVSVDAGASYMITFEDVNFKSGDSESLVLALYNKSSEEVLRYGVFDIEFCRNVNKFEWYFNAPELEYDELQLLFYAGGKERQKENEVVYEGVRLYQVD